MYTGQRAIDRAREILQDAAGVRYTTAQLVAYLNEGIVSARRVRPDLFVGAYSTPLTQFTEATLANLLPTPDSIFVGLAQYIAGRAELRDDEFAVDGRAMTMEARLDRVLLQGI